MIININKEILRYNMYIFLLPNKKIRKYNLIHLIFMRVLINYTNIKTARNSCTSTYCQLLFVSYVSDCCTNLHFFFITIRWLFERTHSGHRSGNENESYEA